jgi:hypothetical protein
MSLHEEFEQMLVGTDPILALAPMQDVTDLPFWRLMTAFGGADLYFTEYFRVHATSNLEKEILRSITENPTGRPVIAQMIGNDIPALIRTARELQQHPIVAVDLNLGCPAQRLSKCAGILREPRGTPSSAHCEAHLYQVHCERTDLTPCPRRAIAHFCKAFHLLRRCTPAPSERFTEVHYGFIARG